MARTLRLGAIPFYLMLCLVLGGSTRGHWANMVLQLLAIAIIAWAAMARRPAPLPKPGSLLVGLIGLMLLLIMLQLLPLPPGIWTALPGRHFVADGYALLGQPLPWLPISLAPYQTMASALWLLPPLAMLVGILRLGAFKASWLAGSLAITTFAAIIIGTLQLAGAGSAISPWYFYKFSNFGEPTGFFANSNHMATLLVVMIPFLMALFGSGLAQRGSTQGSASKIAMLAGAITLVLFGLGMNGSLAGLGLAVPVVAASAMLRVPLTHRWTHWLLGGVAFLGLASLALVLSSPLQNNLTAANAGRSTESRYSTFKTGLAAAADFAPVGSGVGSFVNVYPRYENPELVSRTYVNHVHNDFIEIALETGVAGLILVALFLLWWGGRLIAIWRSPNIDPFARAASIASAAILAHSIVDYPLRTAAISAVFSMCAALMVQPRRGMNIGPAPEGQPARHLSVG
jgi:O-antigen ligase